MQASGQDSILQLIEKGNTTLQPNTAACCKLSRYKIFMYQDVS